MLTDIEGFDPDGEFAVYANVSVAVAAELAGVTPATIRKWRQRGLIAPVAYDDRGRALYWVPDIGRAEYATRHRGRPRKKEIAEPPRLPEPPPPAGFDLLLNRSLKAMVDFGEGAEAATHTAVARIAYRGWPEGHHIRNLRNWCYSRTIEELRDTLIEVIIRELAERAAGEIRPYRSRHPVEDDIKLDHSDLACHYSMIVKNPKKHRWYNLLESA